ncbi:MAG: hypothetical protein GY716_15730 [bacterium]|nr:hypothetical protein [bacterium]
MATLNRFRQDPEKIKRGVPIYFGDPSDPIVFHVSLLQRAIEQAISRMEPERRQAAREGRLPAGELIREAGGDVVLGWENWHEEGPDGQPLLDEAGKPVPVPYSPDRVAELLQDDTLVELHEKILATANSHEPYRRDVVQEQRGN